MPAGIRIDTPSGNLQIDANFRNLAVVDQGTLSFTGSGQIDVSISNPIIAIVPHGNSGGQVSISGGVDIGGGTWRHYIASSLGYLECDWFVFAPAPLITGAGFGMQIFDASGTVVFDARHKYMRVVDQINIAYPPFADSWTRTFTSGRRYAVAFCMRNFFWERSVTEDDELFPPLYLTDWTYYHYAVSWDSGHELSAQWRPFGGGSSGWQTSEVFTPEGSQGVVNFLILDVTNF